MNRKPGSKIDSSEVWGRYRLSDAPFNLALNSEFFVSLNRHKFSNRTPGKLFEIGSRICNSRIFSNRSTKCEVYGVKYSFAEDNTTKIRSRGKAVEYHDLEAGSIPPIGFPDQYFDAVVVRGTIQRNALRTMRGIMSEIRRVLKPGGSFVCSLMPEKQMHQEKGTAISEGGFENPELDGIRDFISRAQNLELFRGFELPRWYVSTRRNVGRRRIVMGVFKFQEYE